nr:hypothetical protein [Pseudoxanthomonas sp.]
MSSTSPSPAARRTGFLFSESAFYELRQLRNHLKLMGYLSAACAGDETHEPTMAIHHWYAGFDSLERQVGQLMSRAEWISVGTDGAAKRRRRSRRKRAPR